MSRQLLFSTLVGIPVSFILGLTRWLAGSHWWILWAAMGALHIKIIADEIGLGSPMKRAAGFALAWALYGLGHIVSRPMTWWGVCGWLYPPYNWLMLRSCDVQDWGGSGPWSDFEVKQ